MMTGGAEDLVPPVSPVPQVRKLLLLYDVVPAHGASVPRAPRCGEPFVNTVCVESMVTRVQLPAVPLGHVFQADRAVIIRVVLGSPPLPVCPHEGPHPVEDGLDAHPTELAIVAISKQSDIFLSFSWAEVRIATLQLC